MPERERQAQHQVIVLPFPPGAVHIAAVVIFASKLNSSVVSARASGSASAIFSRSDCKSTCTTPTRSRFGTPQ
jgi:hypothetical protein